MRRSRGEIAKIAKAIVARVVVDAMVEFPPVEKTVTKLKSADWHAFLKATEEDVADVLLTKFGSSDR